MNRFRDLLRDQTGATALEYSIVAGMISIVILAAVTMIGGSLQTVFYSKLANAFN